MERERVTIQEAARRLGVSDSAIRKRVQRGTLQHEKGQDSRVYVYLDMGETVEDKVRDTSRDELVDELRDRVRFLEEESRRKDSIIMAMTQRIPELQTARDEPQSTETVSESAERVDTLDRGEGAQEGVQRRSSWWRRFFGFE